MSIEEVELHSLDPRGRQAHGERQPFLGDASDLIRSDPVRLTPGWEDTLPQNTEEFQMQNSVTNLATPPSDWFKLVYIILLIHGVGTLMPWNMFITASSYFVDYKLSSNYTNQDTSEYIGNFLQYLGFASQIPNVVFNWLNIFVQIGGNLKTRIVWSIVIEAILFIATIVLAMVDTSASPGLFFWLTMVSVVIINMAGGIYQNSVYGMAAKLDYTGAVVLGSNISGTFTALINILAIAIAPTPRTAAIYYFITALFVLLLCFDTYFALPLNKFYRYHEMLSSKEQENKKRLLPSQLGAMPRTPYLKVFKQCWPQCANVFLVFFVTLALFPAVYSEVKAIDDEFVISEKYFRAVTCFLTFNLMAMIGNMIPGLIQWPGPRFLWIPIVLRFLFIPFFILCNYQPQAITRIFMPGNPLINDWFFWGGGALLGLTSGYFSSLAMMYCPRSVESEYAPLAGMFGAAFLITGIFGGVLLSFIFPWFISVVSLG